MMIETMIEVTVPYEMRALHEAALLRRPPPPFQGPPWKDRSRHRLMAGVLVFVALIIATIWFFDLPQDVILAAEFGAIFGTAFMILTMGKFWAGWTRREAALAPISQTPMAFRLDREGVHADNDVLHQTVRWGGIIGVTQSDGATAIWFSRASLIVMPDEALPDGIKRTDLIAAIDGWREAV